MRFLKQLMCVLTLSGFALAAMASPADPKNGVEYLTLSTPQNTDTGKKIEVIEFFAYYCPHCNTFEPTLEAWIKQQDGNIAFKRVHVPYNDGTLAQQRLFYTLDSLGLADQYQGKVFHAMHVERLRLANDQQVFDWIDKQGIDRKKFADAYNSFGVAAKVRRASAMMEAYQIQSWPTIVIDGRFVTSPSQANEGVKTAQNEQQLGAMALQVMDYLVAKAKAEKK